MRDTHVKRIPRLLTAGTIKGDRVLNPKGEDLGKIHDLMIDLESGRIAYAVLSFGGFLGLGDRLFAVPWPKLRVLPEKHAFVMDANKELLVKAPGFDKDHWPGTEQNELSSAWLTEVYTYYGFTPYWDEMR